MADKLFVRPENEVNDAIERYAEIIYRTCLMMLRCVEDSEDAVQDVFIKYMQYEKDFNDEEHKKAWLITVAINHCKNILRSKSIRDKINFEIYEEKCISDITAEEKQSRKAVMEALFSLDEKFRSVMYLYYVEGYKVKEIAKMLGKGASAIKMRLKKGRLLLLGRYLGEKEE